MWNFLCLTKKEPIRRSRFCAQISTRTHKIISIFLCDQNNGQTNVYYDVRVIERARKNDISVAAGVWRARAALVYY